MRRISKHVLEELFIPPVTPAPSYSLSVQVEQETKLSECTQNVLKWGDVKDVWDCAWNVSYCVQVADWPDSRVQYYFGSPLHYPTPQYCRNPPNSHLSTKQVFSCPRFHKNPEPDSCNPHSILLGYGNERKFDYHYSLFDCHGPSQWQLFPRDCRFAVWMNRFICMTHLRSKYITEMIKGS